MLYVPECIVRVDDAWCLGLETGWPQNTCNRKMLRGRRHGGSSGAVTAGVDRVMSITHHSHYWSRRFDLAFKLCWTRSPPTQLHLEIKSRQIPANTEVLHLHCSRALDPFTTTPCPIIYAMKSRFSCSAREACCPERFERVCVMVTHGVAPLPYSFAADSSAGPRDVQQICTGLAEGGRLGEEPERVQHYFRAHTTRSRRVAAGWQHGGGSGSTAVLR